MIKFGRNYTLKVEVAGKNHVDITLPFSCEFIVNRETLAASQTATFRVFNLAEKTRNQLYKDRFNTTEFRAVQFYAGYQDNTPRIFNGTILQCYSERQGVNFITTIECYCGAFPMANSFTSTTKAAQETQAEIIAALNKDLVGITDLPIIGLDFKRHGFRGQVFMGNTWQAILKISDGYAIIDNGQLKVLGPLEAIKGNIDVITSASGLLGTPKRTNQMIEVEMIFEPRFTLGQIIVLDSQANEIFNNEYKIVGIVHRGMISPSVAGECQTTASLWLGVAALTIVPGVAAQ